MALILFNVSAVKSSGRIGSAAGPFLQRVMRVNVLLRPDQSFAQLALGHVHFLTEIIAASIMADSKTVRTAAPDHRRRELAQIHIAKKQLGMDDDTYRAMLWACARVRSSKHLDYAGRQHVLEHLRKCGFAASGNHEWGWVDTAPKDKKRMLRAIIMLLKSAVPPRRKAYADGMAKGMFHVETLEFCAPDQLHKIVSALKIDAGRRARRVD
jgi:phage gp16-like protein